MSDPCIYIFKADGVFAMIALYVDDIPVACNNTTWRVAFTALVPCRFDIKDHGDLSDIIGMHITRDKTTRTISLDKANTCASCSTSMIWWIANPRVSQCKPRFFGCHLQADACAPHGNGSGHIPEPSRQSAIRRSMYLTGHFDRA
jgi:hypothetical protein